MTASNPFISWSFISLKSLCLKISEIVSKICTKNNTNALHQEVLLHIVLVCKLKVYISHSGIKELKHFHELSWFSLLVQWWQEQIRQTLFYVVKCRFSRGPWPGRQGLKPYKKLSKSIGAIASVLTLPLAKRSGHALAN